MDPAKLQVIQRRVKATRDILTKKQLQYQDILESLGNIPREVIQWTKKHTDSGDRGGAVDREA